MTKTFAQPMARRTLQFATATARKTQTGVMLLEALLGMLIFSMGILAVVGIQTVAIKSVAESGYRMEASFLANRIIGEMWTERTNLSQFVYPTGTPRAEVTAWIADLSASLPGIGANPPVISVVGSLVTVTIFWQHPEEANLATPPPPHNHISVATINFN